MRGSVYQYSFKRSKRDNRTINLMIDKAERIADRKVPLKKASFLKVTGAQKALDQATIDRARQLAGLKGYVTNLPETSMPGSAVINAYHDLWQVKASFGMTKSDLLARPVFHRQCDAIEAHLTVVFAALAIARHLQDATGITVKRIVRTLKSLRTVTVRSGAQTITAAPAIGAAARTILDQLPPINAPGTKPVQLGSE